jgi:hypothetical protein
MDSTLNWISSSAHSNLALKIFNSIFSNVKDSDVRILVWCALIYGAKMIGFASTTEVKVKKEKI